MKKMNKKEVIRLLQQKNSKTFKELANITGYHEKSLTRLAKELRLGICFSEHRNIGKEPFNKISALEKEKIKKLWNERLFSTKKAFYLFLCSKGYSYSYSFVAKIIKKEKKQIEKKKVSDVLSIPRKVISEKNIIQYNSKRYLVDSNISIPHHACVILNVDRKTLEPLFIEYNGKKYPLIFQKTVFSRKGNTKYE